MYRSARRYRVWDSSTVCQWVLIFSPVGQLRRPLKSSYAGEPGHTPLREVDDWTCIMIEIGKSLIRPEGSGFALAIQSPTAFSETKVEYYTCGGIRV